MRAASAEFRRTMTQRRNFVNYADMTLSNGTVLHLKPEDFRLGGNTIEDDLVDGDSFTVGSIIGKTVTIALDNSSEFFSQFDFYGAYFVLYVALPLPTEQQPERVEKIRIGYFTVITPATTGTVITMEAVDNMYKFDKPYSESNLTYPATLQQIVVEACNHCGVTNNTGQFDRYLMQVSNKPEGDITYRQVLSYVAQIAGVNAKIDDLGGLTFVWYTDTVPEAYADGGNFRKIYKPDGSYATGDALDGGSFAYNDGDAFDGGLFGDPMAYHDLGPAKSVKIGTDDIVITGVRVKNGDTDVLSGSAGYVITLDDNPLTVGVETNVANALYAKLMYLTFRTFSLSYLQDPTIEAGDWVIVEDIKHNTVISFCTNVKFTTGNYMSISCNAQSPAKQGSTYSSAAAKAIVEQMRLTSEQISDYDMAVQRMNMLAANAMGLYWLDVPQADGSTIFYESDKPLSIDSDGNVVFTYHSHVWKRTGSGFFSTASSGTSESTTTWTGGIDANNNAVMNTISTIGLTADWINTGTLDSIKITTGSTYGSKFVIESGQIKAYYDNTYLGAIRTDQTPQYEPRLNLEFMETNGIIELNAQKRINLLLGSQGNYREIRLDYEGVSVSNHLYCSEVEAGTRFQCQGSDGIDSAFGWYSGDTYHHVEFYGGILISHYTN